MWWPLFPVKREILLKTQFFDAETCPTVDVLNLPARRESERLRDVTSLFFLPSLTWCWLRTRSATTRAPSTVGPLQSKTFSTSEKFGTRSQLEECVTCSSGAQGAAVVVGDCHTKPVPLMLWAFPTQVCRQKGQQDAGFTPPGSHPVADKLPPAPLWTHEANVALAKSPALKISQEHSETNSFSVAIQ